MSISSDDTSEESPIDALFTIQEVKAAIHNVQRKSALGPDRVTTQTEKPT